SVGSLVSMVEALLGAPPELATRGAQVAVDLLGYPVSQEGDATYRENEEVRQVAWRALERSVADAGAESYWWGRLLDALAPYDLDGGIATTCRGLVSEDLSVQEEATRCIAILAAEHGRRVLAELEGLLRDPDAFLMLSVGPRMGFWGSFPESELEEWLERQ